MLLPLIRVVLQRLLPLEFSSPSCNCGCDEGMSPRCQGSSISAEEDLDCAPVLVPMRLISVIDEEFNDR
jgi:hypothetical protein